ncbi:sensor histidine kinase [Salmonirosea aquatica]|uniref:histidine kinase n=1 Tax=Salmonirosea aquatica TaxID=2654236 RepID=A0A7C9BFK1_9BACT|nr:two-component sensor histidine kinase [Cytophagaceae bacterium SJW1-29]
MEEIIEFFSRLGDSSDWPPRWQCGTWSDFHGWLYIISDLMIWLAYMCIPVILLRFIFVKQGVPLKRVFWLFGAFILLCGLTHLVDAFIFWVPVYRISALVRFLAGIVSIATVVALVKYFDDAVGLKTSQEFEHELKYRQKALQTLEMANEELNQFAYVASHDLQSPLKTIEGYLGLLESRYASQLDEAGLKLVRTTASSANRMRTLINDLLDFSQTGLNQEFAQVDMDILMAETLEELQNEISASGAQMRVSPLPVLWVARNDIKRVMQNLIGNAIKYSKKGSVPEIEIWAREKPDDWLFCVSDNGIGIDETYFNKIFLVFQRLHGRQEYPGTGVGLATCKKIIETHGGKIWVQSSPGKGSDFFFTIPKNPKTIHDFQRTE